jgi:Protein of unknown function (DUF3617)
MNRPHRQDFCLLAAPRRRATLGFGWCASFAIGAWCLSAAFATADGIEPGEWQLTETITVNGQEMPAQVRSRYLTAEEASDTAKTFTPEYRTVNSNCEQVEFKSTATTLNWRMQCTGQMDMDVSGEFVFDTPKHYSGRIVSKGAVGGRQFVDSRVTIEGEHVDENK